MKPATMSEPRDRSNKPAEPKADDAKTEAPKSSGSSEVDASLDLIAAVMAKAHGEAQGKVGGELRAHVADIVSQVKTVVTVAAAENAAETDRQRAAAELEQLFDVIMRSAPAMAAALGPYRDAVVKQLKGVDIEQIANVMQLLAGWMHKPDAATEAQVKQLVAKMQDEMGPLTGEDPVAQAEARRAKIRSGIAKNLDEIFKKPDVSDLASATKPDDKKKS